jgi:hypothetical protein
MTKRKSYSANGGASRVMEYTKASLRALNSEERGIGRGVSSDPAQLHKGDEQNTGQGNTALAGYNIHPQGDADFPILKEGQTSARTEPRSNPQSDMGHRDFAAELGMRGKQR